MEIILKEDIIGLGYKNDIVNVKNGYGRNYLIPTGKGVIASPSARKQLAENLKQQAAKLAALKAEAEKKLVGKVILRDLQHDEGADYKGGKIYDPESGKTYSCKATRQADGNLKVRGFIGASLFGRTTLWTRQR